MIALEFKTVFLAKGIEVTTNWKTDTGWQGEEQVDYEWIDSKGSKFQKILIYHRLIAN
jgi:hypothetical protein